jgi:hypothetical protein
MKLFGRTLEGFAQALVALVAIFLVSCGLCGIFLGIANAGQQNGPSSPLSGLFAAAGLAFGAVIVVSLLGIAIVGVVWLITATIRNSSRPQHNPQKTRSIDPDAEDKLPH